MTPAPDFLATLRVLGYTPSQAAQAVGTTTRTVQSIVAGQREATRTMAIALHQHAQLVAAGIEERVPAIRRGPKKAA